MSDFDEAGMQGLVYEGKKFDKRNFCRKIELLKILKPLRISPRRAKASAPLSICCGALREIKG